MGAQLSMTAVLNCLDGLTASEGRILFMTTNSHHRLDSAMLRPGRIDRQIEFKHATQDQIHRIFELFYSDYSEQSEIDGSNSPATSREQAMRTGRVRTAGKGLRHQALVFAEAVPAGQYTVAELSSFLQLHASPSDAIRQVLLDEGNIKAGPSGAEPVDHIVANLDAGLARSSTLP